MDVLVQVKQSFFDRGTVIAATTEGNRKVLSKFGAFVRQRARTSMRRKSGTSQPGDPPFAHAGQVRDLLFFSWDASTKSVVVGPVALKRFSGVPALLETGGAIPRGSRTARYRSRPYMGPALAAEQPKFAQLYRNSIGG